MIIVLKRKKNIGLSLRKPRSRKDFMWEIPSPYNGTWLKENLELMQRRVQIYQTRFKILIKQIDCDR